MENKKKDEYKILLAILSEYIKIDEYIFLFFEQFGIDLIKVLINGYLQFEDKEIDLLPIIQKLVPLIPEKVYIYIYYIYNQFSEIFRLDLKDNESEKNIKSSFEKFSALFNIWKNMLNYDENSYKKYVFFYGNNSINIEPNDKFKDEFKIFININLIKSPLLSINNNIEDCFILGIYTELKYFVFPITLLYCKIEKVTDIDSINIIINEKNEILYGINNDKINMIQIDWIGFKKSEIKKIEIMKNFYGKISPIEFIIEDTDKKSKKVYQLNHHNCIIVNNEK